MEIAGAGTAGFEMVGFEAAVTLGMSAVMGMRIVVAAVAGGKEVIVSAEQRRMVAAELAVECAAGVAVSVAFDRVVVVIAGLLSEEVESKFVAKVVVVVVIDDATTAAGSVEGLSVVGEGSARMGRRECHDWHMLADKADECWTEAVNMSRPVRC